MVKTEFAEIIRVGMLEHLHETFGMAVEINNGEITGVVMEGVDDGCREKL